MSAGLFGCRARVLRQGCGVPRLVQPLGDEGVSARVGREDSR